MNLNIIIGILEQGFIYSIIVMGVYVTYHILDFPDLTVDGSFPLGGAVATFFILRGSNLAFTLFLSLIVGALAGLVTGLLHVKFEITNLLSSILTMTGLYSINIAINNTPNVFLPDSNNIFSIPFFENIEPFKNLLIILFFVIIVKLALDYFFKTKAGMLMRATGDNKQIVTSLGKSSDTITVIGLMIANGLVALGGAIYIQRQGTYDVSMGTGTMVICLASVIIGLQAFKKFKNTTSVILGSLVYTAIMSIVIEISISLGFKPHYSRLIMTILFGIVLIYNNHILKKNQ